MINIKYGIPLVLFLGCTMLMNCAGSSSTIQQNSPAYQAPDTYPEWYNENRSVVNDEEVYRGYAVVLASDSSATVRRAVQRAKSRLGSSISNKLESIRNDALVEYGSESNLDQSNFILALNKSGRTIRRVAEESNGEVALQGSSENYFGFAEVTLNKEDLIERLDRTFSAHEKSLDQYEGIPRLLEILIDRLSSSGFNFSISRCLFFVKITLPLGEIKLQLYN